MFEEVAVREVREALAALRDLVGRVVPEAVPLPEAPAMWQAFDGIERLAASAKTLLAGRVDESSVWQRAGDRSAPEYLARKSGSSLGAARTSLETSKRVRTLPQTRSAMQRGELSRAQADEIAGAASANPGAERSLLASVPGSSLTELRERCARTRAAADPDRDATQRRIHRERRLRRWTDAEGAWNLSARGTPDAGSRFNAVLNPIIDELFQAARSAGRRETREAYAFDALIELARRSGREGAAPGPRGAPDTSRAEGSGSQPARASNPTHLALLRIDLEALVRGRVKGDEVCEVAGVGPVPVSTARDLLGDSIVKLVITNGVDVANVTHLGRGPTAAQRVALLWTSAGCVVEGCSSTIGIETDHRVPWADDRVTELANLDRLCSHHHDLKTRQGWALAPGTGKRPMVPPGDPRHAANQSPNAAPTDPRPPPGPTAPGSRPFGDAA
ncbi:MAG TPA: DUF222 domain-containing protein [Acidimicrobiales bacterium]|nr:DUF222 domain-containing protein [Acidimicrobiales bacterium]